MQVRGEDISPEIVNLTTEVRNPNQNEWRTLVRLMKFLKQTCKDVLALCANGSNALTWHVDAAFAVNPDFKCHMGATMTIGDGGITPISHKQGTNTRSSTKAEVVAADEIVGLMLWTNNFLESQGYLVKKNVLFQENWSAMLLEANG